MTKDIDPINQAVRNARKAFEEAQAMQTHRPEHVSRPSPSPDLQGVQ
jgi:hypothetical protein